MDSKRRNKLKKKALGILTGEKLRFYFWKFFHKSTVSCPHDGVYISSRADRYGANSVPWLNAIALARISNLPLYHHCSVNCFRYRDSVIHRILVTRSIQSKHCARCDLHGKNGWFGAQHDVLMAVSAAKPLPDVIAESTLKEELFDFYRAEAQAKSWTLPFEPKRSITIHVRLDDIRLHEKENKQGFIGEEKLCELIKKLHSRYPHHHIHLITTPHKRDIETCETAIRRSNVGCTVSGNRDVDYDLYLMMCSDVLILSRSTFCFIAALLHQGGAVFSYTNWAHFEELVGATYAGGDRRNRSNYIKLLDL